MAASSRRQRQHPVRQWAATIATVATHAVVGSAMVTKNGPRWPFVSHGITTAPPEGMVKDHLTPVFAALHRGELRGVAVWANQNAGGRFTREPGWLVIIGDDLGASGGSKGPLAFHQDDLIALLAGSETITTLSGEAVAAVYKACADVAVKGQHVTIIETQPEHERAWLDLVKAVAPRAHLLIVGPPPTQDDDHFF
jgi:hypothetical protein